MYKILQPILFFLFILTSEILSAQQYFIDSLNTVLQKETSLSIKGRLNIKIGKEYVSRDTLKAKQYLKLGFDLADMSGDDMGKGMFHLYTAYLQCNKGLYREGLNSFNKASEYFDVFSKEKNITESERKENTSLEMDAELSRGNVQLELYEYQQAEEIFWKVLKLLETSDFPDKNAAIAATYQAIALSNYHREQYQTALDNYLKAVPYTEKSGNEYIVAENQIYAAMCYTLIKKYDSSTLLLKKTEPIVLKINNPALNTMYYARVAELNRFTGQWKEANSNYDKAISNAVVTGNIYMQATFNSANSRCLLKLNKLIDAREAALKSLFLAQSINKKREILEAQKVLSLVEYAAMNYKQAYNYLKEYNRLNDSLNTVEVTEKILVLDKKYQTEKHLNTIHNLEADTLIKELKLNKRAIIIQSLICVSFTILIISLLLFRNYRQKRRLQENRIQKLEAEKLLSATEALLKGEEQERNRLAKDLHDGLGGMLSGIKYSLNKTKENLIMTKQNSISFERSLDMLDSSIKELRRVAHNMMPEALFNFGLDAALHDFCNDINQSGKLEIRYLSYGFDDAKFDTTTVTTIYRLVLELINNSLKHASARNLIVQVSKNNKQIMITVEDDGIGFNPSILKKTEGSGWVNIKNRVDFLKGKIDINSEQGKGTSVNIEFYYDEN